MERNISYNNDIFEEEKYPQCALQLHPPHRKKVTLLGSRLIASLTCNPVPPPLFLIALNNPKYLLNTFFESKEIICNGDLDYFRFSSTFRVSLLISRIKSTHFAQFFLLIPPENFRKPCQYLSKSDNPCASLSNKKYFKVTIGGPLGNLLILQGIGQYRGEWSHLTGKIQNYFQFLTMLEFAIELYIK